jgi:hypothetical protein
VFWNHIPLATDCLYAIDCSIIYLYNYTEYLAYRARGADLPTTRPSLYICMV